MNALCMKCSGGKTKCNTGPKGWWWRKKVRDRMDLGCSGLSAGHHVQWLHPSQPAKERNPRTERRSSDRVKDCHNHKKPKTAASESAPSLSLPSVWGSAVSIKMYPFRSPRLSAPVSEGRDENRGSPNSPSGQIWTVEFNRRNTNWLYFPLHSLWHKKTPGPSVL